MNKAEKISKMLRAGATVNDITKKLKVSKSYVYAVKNEVYDLKPYPVPDEPEMPLPPIPAHKPVNPTPLEVQVGGSHYKNMKIQPVEFIHANGIPYIEGAVIKYVSRWRSKGGMEDLKKAAHFLELLMQLETNKEEA